MATCKEQQLARLISDMEMNVRNVGAWAKAFRKVAEVGANEDDDAIHVMAAGLATVACDLTERWEAAFRLAHPGHRLSPPDQATSSA